MWAAAGSVLSPMSWVRLSPMSPGRTMKSLVRKRASHLLCTLLIILAVFCAIFETDHEKDHRVQGCQLALLAPTAYFSSAARPDQ